MDKSTFTASLPLVLLRAGIVGPFSPAASGSTFFLAPVSRIVGADDFLDQRMAHDIDFGKPGHPMPSTFSTASSASSRPDFWPAGRSICVRSPVTAIRDPSPRRVRNISHLHRRGVLRFVENDVGIRQGATAHEGQRRDLDLARRQTLQHLVAGHHVVERVIKRTQIGIDFSRRSPGRKPRRSPASTAGRER